MNLATITSIFRHWITAAAGVLGLWLIANLALSGDESKQLTEALAKLIEPTVAVLGLVGVAVARLAIKWLGKVFRYGSGELENGGPSGGIGLLLMITAAVIGGSLPSCSPTEWPVTGSITYRDPTSGAKGGLTFSPGSAPVASLKVPIYDPQTGNMIGLADLRTNFPQVDAKSGK